MCVIFNKRFATNNGLDKYIQEKHMELSCKHFGKMFRNRKEVDNHMKVEELEMAEDFKD